MDSNCRPTITVSMGTVSNTVSLYKEDGQPISRQEVFINLTRAFRAAINGDLGVCTVVFECPQCGKRNVAQEIAITDSLISKAKAIVNQRYPSAPPERAYDEISQVIAAQLLGVGKIMVITLSRRT